MSDYHKIHPQPCGCAFCGAETAARLAQSELAPARGSADCSREALGRAVRDIWVEWAKEQPTPKPTWLKPWDALPEPDKEVDRRIGEKLFELGWSARAADFLERYTIVPRLAEQERRP